MHSWWVLLGLLAPGIAAGATITGRVTNRQTGAPLMVVTVVATSPSRASVVEFTGKDGRYTLTVPEGTYDLLFVFGDENETRGGIVVGSDDVVTVDVPIDVDESQLITICDDWFYAASYTYEDGKHTVAVDGYFRLGAFTTSLGLRNEQVDLQLTFSQKVNRATMDLILRALDVGREARSAELAAAFRF